MAGVGAGLSQRSDGSFGRQVFAISIFSPRMTAAGCRWIGLGLVGDVPTMTPAGHFHHYLLGEGSPVGFRAPNIIAGGVGDDPHVYESGPPHIRSRRLLRRRRPSGGQGQRVAFNDQPTL